MNRNPFHFKQFKIYHDRCSMKVGTDGVLLGAWTTIYDSKSILDIGTGSGLIAIMLAQRSKENVTIDAVDIDDNAYNQAVENITNCRWKNRIKAHHANIQSFADKSVHKYDLIITNPPYFITGSKSKNKLRNLARHSDTLPQNDLINIVCNLLSPKGKFSVILPVAEGYQFIELATICGLYCNKITTVKPKFDTPTERLLLEFSTKKNVTIKNKLIIQYIERNHYTPAYIKLTKDFYTIM